MRSFFFIFLFGDDCRSTSNYLSVLWKIRFFFFSFCLFGRPLKRENRRLSVSPILSEVFVNLFHNNNAISSQRNRRWTRARWRDARQNIENSIGPGPGKVWDIVYAIFVAHYVWRVFVIDEQLLSTAHSAHTSYLSLFFDEFVSFACNPRELEVKKNDEEEDENHFFSLSHSILLAATKMRER